MSKFDPNTVKQILLNSIQGGDVDNNGNLIAKISLKKLFQQFATDMDFIKISLDGDNIYLYIATKIGFEPIQLDNGLKIDLSQYTGTSIVKIPIKKKFIDDLIQIANMPIIGIEEVKIGDTTDVVIKVNTGRRMAPQPTQAGGGIDF
jgi:hypothetical protein